MRRGLSLIELLLALALLGTIFVAAVSWTQLAGRAGPDLVAPAAWERAAHDALLLIQDDLLIADVPPPDGRRRVPRVLVANDELTIQTRNAVEGAAGPVRHRYRLDSFRGMLEIRERREDGRSTSRHVLPGVAQWECTVDEDHGLLTILIADRAGMVVERRFALP